MWQYILELAQDEDVRVILNLAFAGMFGGVVRVLTLQEKGWRAVSSIGTGTICAVYISPITLPLLENALGPLSLRGNTVSLSGFLTGVGGTTITHVILRALYRVSEKSKDDKS